MTEMTNKKHLKLGILFFLSSFIVGYGGVAITGGFYFWTDNNNWLWIGSVIYGFSWVFFGIGFFLAGKEGLKYLKSKKNSK